MTGDRVKPDGAAPMTPTPEERRQAKLLADASDLLKQATTERSHYYVADVVKRMLAEIRALTREREEARREIAALVEALREALEDGHPEYCHALKGPEHEHWTVEEDCTCWHKGAKAALADLEGEGR